MELRENVYKIKSLSDNGVAVTLNLIEDIELEPVSQQQMMLEAINRAIPDKEMKEQLQPIMEAMLRANHKRLYNLTPKQTLRLLCPNVITRTMESRKWENH